MNVDERTTDGWGETSVIQMGTAENTINVPASWKKRQVVNSLTLVDPARRAENMMITPDEIEIAAFRPYLSEKYGMMSTRMAALTKKTLFMGEMILVELFIIARSK